MKRRLFAIPAFVAGLILGLYLSRSMTAHAQTQTKTVVQATVVATMEAFKHPKTPPTAISGKVVGFACAQDRCFVLTER